MRFELRKEPKRLAIVSYGTRVSITSKNVRSVDLIYLRDILQNVYGRQVDFVSKVSRSDAGIPYFKDIYNTDLNDYDEVVVYNCSLNPFGGVFKDEAITTMMKMHGFKGDLYYYLCDPKMPCADFAAYLKYKAKGTGKVPADNKDGFREVSDEYLDEWSKSTWPRIKIMFAGCDYDKYYEIFTKKNAGRTTVSSRLNPDYDWCFVPLFEYYAVNEMLDEKLRDYPVSDKKHDLVYFGNNRMTERNKIIESFYDQEGLDCQIIGYDPKFTKCKYEHTGYVSHDELFPMICNSYATLVLGDTLHNNNTRTPRFFEAMLLDVVAFIYEKYDEEHKFVSNPRLRELIYVKTPEELRKKIDIIKKDEQLRKEIIAFEREDVLNQFKHMVQSK